MEKKFQKGKSFTNHFSPRRPATAAPQPNPACEASPLPRAHLSRRHLRPTCRGFFPQSSPLLRSIPTAGAIPAHPRHERSATAALCHPVPSLSLPVNDCGSYRCLTPVAPPLLRCDVAAWSRCRRKELDDEALTQHALLTELALPKGHRLRPHIALPACTRGRIGMVH
jgi:hypothetical protein